jgi:hypothetical protein
MSYYILPKIQNNITLDLHLQKESVGPYISHSLIYYYNDTLGLIQKLCQTETDEIFSSLEELSKIVNPYEYIFSKVTGSKFSVSKIKPFSNTFYDFLEISQTLNMFDTYVDANISSLHFGKNRNSTIECMNIMREDNNDVNVGFENLEAYYKDNDATNDDENRNENNIHFLYYENSENKNTLIGAIEFMVLLLQKQKPGGFSVIKIDDLFYKPILDLLYLLSSVYEKIYVIKPNTSLVTSFQKYIVCKYFTCDYERITLYLKKLVSILEKIKSTDLFPSNLIKGEIPYYFMNKIEEANIIVGQQQLESLDQVVGILKNKNRDDKVETLKKTNLQKCIHWCEKYKIPYNKFSEKVNIFLPFMKSEEEKTSYEQSEIYSEMPQTENENENEDENEHENKDENENEGETDTNVVIEIFESNDKFY